MILYRSIWLYADSSSSFTIVGSLSATTLPTSYLCSRKQYIVVKIPITDFQYKFSTPNLISIQFQEISQPNFISSCLNRAQFVERAVILQT